MQYEALFGKEAAMTGGVDNLMELLIIVMIAVCILAIR